MGSFFFLVVDDRESLFPRATCRNWVTCGFCVSCIVDYVTILGVAVLRGIA